MSIALMTLAWKSTVPSGRKLVLLALCDNANDQGECYPSMTMLASKCSMSLRSVQVHIADLETAGIVRREYRYGRSTVYQIDPRNFCTPQNLHPAESASQPRRICTSAESAPPQNLRHTPAESAPPPPQNLHPTPAESAPITIIEPSIEPSVNRKHRARSASTDFSAKDALLLEGVSEQVAMDWLAVRKAHKAPLTQTALDEVKREAEKAGMTLDGALTVCCSRGWRGFKAEWVAPQSVRMAGGRESAQAGDRLSRAGRETANNAQIWLEEQENAG